MYCPRLILCPVDFSEHARRALEYAAAFAALHQARLVVHTAIDPLLAEAAAIGFHSDYLRDTRADLRAFISSAAIRQVRWAPEPRVVVTIGAADGQILDVADFYHADLIVMGTQGLGGVRKLVFGSTTEHVLRRSEVPVLAVPLGGPPFVTFEPNGPRFRVKEVLAAVDLTGESQGVASLAADVARGLHAALLLTHVVQPVEATARWRDPRDGATMLHVATAQAAIEALASRVEISPPAQHIVVTGHPADAITSTAASRHAGLIVIGVGAAGLGSHRPGATAYRVLCLSDVPVLTVPPARMRRVADPDAEATREVVA
jgi:nucleotide-binding universal stress UspA family protein